MIQQILKALSDYESSPLKRAATVDEIVKSTYGPLLQHIYNTCNNYRVRVDIENFCTKQGIDLSTVRMELYELNKHGKMVLKKHSRLVGSRHRPSVQKRCAYCNKQYMALTEKLNIGKGLYCSISCSNKARKQAKQQTAA